MMNLFTKDGTAKIVRECTYPLTGLRCVRRVYTGRAIFDIDSDGGTVRVRETFGISINDLRPRATIKLS
jgi:3-oxoadipate CoA-transferase beta subunit